MKLDVKRTVLVGMAFLSISAFWQMYDSVIPLVLTNTFHMDEVFSGAIMAADNVLALFLLPLFGGLSDKCTSKLGRRKPFILRGTLVAAALMMILPMLDNSYYAAPAGWKLAAFVSVLGLLLVTMGTYRSPAVALMPDVTPKPLRSKANAIINLMGAVGGILYLIITSVLYSAKRTAGMEHVSYTMLFGIVAGIMLLALIILMTTINEPALAAKQAEYEAAHPEDDVAPEAAETGALPAAVKRSLGFLLVSISLWFFGYNAISTWFTTYANNVWNMPLGSAAMCLTIATAGAIVSYIPVGSIASKVGRKKTILFGVCLLSVSFFMGFVYTCFFDHFSPILYLLFICVGIAWASINVNSLPMVVEMCKGGEVGKFTGYYYTFSMAAQTLTPVVSGWLIRQVGYKALFPYAAIAVALAFVTMQFVKHGDTTCEGKKGLEAFDLDD